MPPRDAATTDGSPAVVVVAALRAEARGLIDHFAMTRDDAGAPFARFTARRAPLSLVLSGCGKVAAGAAVAHAALSAPGTAWLNIGIAGHAEHPLGRLFLAHRVRDVASGRAWYPPLVFTPPCPTASLHTVDNPCSDFPDDALYDMEGAGFYDIAARHAPHELVHCLKVVSDNRDHPASQLDAGRVTQLMDGALPLICKVIEELAALGEQHRRLHAEPAGFDDILGAAHFSVTRRRQLRRALRRWSVLCPEADAVAWVKERAPRNAAAILADIERHLDEQPWLPREAC